LISEAAKGLALAGFEAGHAERVHPAFIDMPPGETMPHRSNWKRPSFTSEWLGCSESNGVAAS
jgi:hypothetical protein